jgi:AraC-like DNA-binding protein
MQFCDADFFSKFPTTRDTLALFDFLPGVIFYAKDRAGRYVAANAAMLASKRLHSADQLLGYDSSHFHPPALARAYMEEDERVMCDGKPHTNQTWFVIDSNGHPGWFSSTKLPLRDRNRDVIGLASARYPIATPDDGSGPFQNLSPAIRHLEKNYHKRISMEGLAESCGLSVAQFNRRFNAMFRTSPKRFIMVSRVDKARQLLTSTSMTISAIAFDTGFYDQSHLTRHFRKITGMTPRAYRKRFQGSLPH